MCEVSYNVNDFDLESLCQCHYYSFNYNHHPPHVHTSTLLCLNKLLQFVRKISGEKGVNRNMLERIVSCKFMAWR